MNPSRFDFDKSARFAVAPNEEGVGLFHSSLRGLRCAVSNDGLRWRSVAPAGCSTEGLRPLCAGREQGAGGPDLFCTDPEGRVVPIHTRSGRLSADTPFQPLTGPDPWYETLPNLEDLTITWDPHRKVYRAFFCGRRSRGRHADRRGCIGVATSPNLTKWNMEPPVFSPNRYRQMFSPHVLTHEGHTVLFYATPEEGEHRALRFALAPHQEGPYERTEPDVLTCDCRISIHTVPVSGGQLVFFGRSLPYEQRPHSVSRPGRLDFNPGGRPFVRFYDPLLQLIGREIMTTEATLSSGEILVRMFPRNGKDFRLSLRVRSLGAAAAGVLFRTNTTGSDNITLWLDYVEGALILRRGVRGRLLCRVPRDLSFHTDYGVVIWAEGPFANVFVDDEWVLTAHTEARLSGAFGVTVRRGEARFDDISAQIIQAD